MSDHAAIAPSAEVIPFPQPAPVVVVETPEQRLQRALASLAEAQQAQREAVALWRVALADLQTSMSKLGTSVDNYRQTLNQISSNLAP